MLSQTENTLSGIVKSLTRADQLTIQALNGPNGEKELKAIGAEIDQILKQVVYLANTKEQGRYLLVEIMQRNLHLRMMGHTKVAKRCNVEAK